MNKDYIKPVAVFFITVITTYFICFQINVRSDTLKNGQAFPHENKYKLYSLSSYEWNSDTNRYYFNIIKEAGSPALALVYGAIDGVIYINDKAEAQPVTFSKFSQIALNSGLSDGVSIITISFYSKKNPNSLPIYITSADGAARAISMYNMIFAFCLGITFLMSVYGLSLYINKKSEKYLIWFSVYTGALTLWSLSSIFLDLNLKFFQPFFSHAYGWCALLDIVICFKMFDIHIPHPFRFLLEVKGITMFLIIWAIFETLYKEYFRDYYYIFFFSIAVLIYACAKKRKGAIILLTGHTVSMGMRLVVAFSPFKMTSVSYLLMIMRYSKLFNLPFAICCMFMINRLFSEKFTEAEVLADKLEQTNKILEIKVNERTRELKEQQKQRNAFIMNIFHDLRTPLFILEGCIKKIKQHPLTVNYELPTVEDRLDFVKHLVDDLFLLAKFEDKQVILETERVSLNMLLEKVISSCLIVSNKKSVILNSKITCSCTTWGDECRLEQAFQNIIMNAVYYTKPGGTICVELCESNNTAFVIINDTGVGIPEEDLDKIFHRYYKITGTRKHESTGLGLSIANEIINCHRGTINVKSTVGKGTEFTVQLPLITS